MDKSMVHGRLRKAVAFHRAARVIHELMGDIEAPDVLSANAVLAAIAYADAITAAILGQVNQQDHKGITALLRSALQQMLPVAEENRLRRLMDRKDEASYGEGIGRQADNDVVMADLDKFAAFATRILSERGVRLAPPQPTTSQAPDEEEVPGPKR